MLNLVDQKRQRHENDWQVKGEPPHVRSMSKATNTIQTSIFLEFGPEHFILTPHEESRHKTGHVNVAVAVGGSGLCPVARQGVPGGLPGLHWGLSWIHTETG